MSDEVDVAVEHVGTRHQVNVIRDDPESFQEVAGPRAYAPGLTDGHGEPSGTRERLKRRVLGRKDRRQERMLPGIRSAGAGGWVGAQYRTDVVILEPGGEDVRRAVTRRVHDEHDRTVIALTDRVAELSMCPSAIGKPSE